MVLDRNLASHLVHVQLVGHGFKQLNGKTQVNRISSPEDAEVCNQTALGITVTIEMAVVLVQLVDIVDKLGLQKTFRVIAANGQYAVMTEIANHIASEHNG